MHALLLAKSAKAAKRIEPVPFDRPAMRKAIENIQKFMTGALAKAAREKLDTGAGKSMTLESNPSQGRFDR